MAIVDLTHVIDWSREALRMSLLLGGPLLAVALLAGLVINVLQTVTQLHEPLWGWSHGWSRYSWSCWRSYPGSLAGG